MMTLACDGKAHFVVVECGAVSGAFYLCDEVQLSTRILHYR